MGRNKCLLLSLPDRNSLYYIAKRGVISVCNLAPSSHCDYGTVICVVEKHPPLRTFWDRCDDQNLKDRLAKRFPFSVEGGVNASSKPNCIPITKAISANPSFVSRRDARDAYKMSTMICSCIFPARKMRINVAA